MTSDENAERLNYSYLCRMHRLFECMSIMQIPLDQEQLSLLHDIIDECLGSSADDIQVAAVAALGAFSAAYLAPQLDSSEAPKESLPPGTALVSILLRASWR